MSEVAKVDGWVPHHPKDGWMGSCIETIVVERDYDTALNELIDDSCGDGSERFRQERIAEVKAEGWKILPVRIIPATQPTAAEVIAELREWVLHTTWTGSWATLMHAFDAKLTEIADRLRAAQPPQTASADKSGPRGPE